MVLAAMVLADRLHRYVTDAEPQPHPQPQPRPVDRTGEGQVGAGGVVLVVLGVPGSNALYRAVQRWRVALALDAQRRWGADRVVFTGGATRSARSEAEQMASLARRGGMDPALIVLEERARTTRENVVESARLLDGATLVVLVSDAFHASRARTYWREHAGPAAPQLVLADRYRPFDRIWLRTAVTLADLAYRAVTRGRGRAARP